LREAVMAHGGWPSLAAARGKVIFVLNDTPQKTALYADASQTLAGKTMFVTAPESSPLASFIAIENPLKDSARIGADVRLGFMVLTKADEQTREARQGDTKRRDAAFASGAQLIQTDFLLPDKAIGPYQVTIADSRHARCDAMLGADGCAV
jgi:hypothetical protein